MSNAATLPSRAAAGGSFDPFRGIAHMFRSFTAASRCCEAIRADRRPNVRDLKILGLQDLSFDNLRG